METSGKNRGTQLVPLFKLDDIQLLRKDISLVVHGSPPQIAQETRNLHVVAVMPHIIVDALESPLFVFSHKVVKKIDRLSAIKTPHLLLYQQRDHEIKIDKLLIVELVFLNVLHLVARNLVLDLPPQLSTNLFGCSLCFLMDRL
jgi:hypothetical protein